MEVEAYLHNHINDNLYRTIAKRSFKTHVRDCVDGMIRVPKRQRAIRKAIRDPIRIDPELAEILDDWLPVRRQGKGNLRSHLRYGEKFADNGLTRNSG